MKNPVVTSLVCLFFVVMPVFMYNMIYMGRTEERPAALPEHYVTHMQDLEQQLRVASMAKQELLQDVQLCKRQMEERVEQLERKLRDANNAASSGTGVTDAKKIRPEVPKFEFDEAEPTPAEYPEWRKGVPVLRTDRMLIQQYLCPLQQKIGLTEGGWVTCLLPQLAQDSVVYSFGLGNDPAFDLTYLKMYPGSEVHAFDPTPTGENCYKRTAPTAPAGWVFHDWGLNKEDANMTFFAPKGHDQWSIKDWDGKYDEGRPVIREGYTLKTIMEKLGHKHVDIVKIDIEGSEWELIDQFLENPPNADQLFFEFHFFDLDMADRYSPQLDRFISALNHIGYDWFFTSSFRTLGKRYKPPAHHHYAELSFIKPHVARRSFKGDKRVKP